MRSPEANPTWANDNTPQNTVAGRFIEEQRGRTLDGVPTFANDNAPGQTANERERSRRPHDYDNVAETDKTLREDYAREQAERNQVRSQQVSNPAKATKTAANVVGTAVAVSRPLFYWLSSWHAFQWFSLQLTLGIISTAMLGLAASLEETWIGRRVGEIAGAANVLTSFVGMDFSALNPLNLFFVLYTITLGLLLLSLLGTIGVYLTVQHKPLSGQGIGLKYSALIITIVGYAIPVANLIPWIFLYLFVMRRYPR